MAKEKNGHETVEESKRIRTREELTELAAKCAASENAAEARAGRIALRALRSVDSQFGLNVVDALRAGAVVPEFADLLALYKMPTRWMWQAVCRAFGAAVRGTGHEIDLGKHVPDEDEIAGLCEEFAAAGFHVTPEAIAHNVSAWKADMKSGYLCEDCHLFTPCGCNGLSLRAERLVEGADWQSTYMA